MKLLLDTNVVIDYLHEREPYYDKVRLLMTAGRVGEFSLWITSSQVTDLIYILSEGGKRSLLSRVLEQLRGMRTFVNVHAVSDREVDRMLAASWKDPEDSLIFESALEMRAMPSSRAIGRFRVVGDQSGGLRRILRLDAQGLRIGLRRGGHLARCVIGRI
ncbi:MAG: type II toxin-antitoxin system VapC family toxin [Eggerthella lenta]